MSQIAAAVAWSGEVAILDADVETALRPWPADSRRVTKTPGGVLGCARLSTDGRGDESSPWLDVSRSLAITADGRLDNREDLRRQLAVDDATNDSRLLLRAYERWGAHFGEHFLGDFHCVIWDWRQRQLIAARDALGIKPLYYAALPNGLVVASDVEIIVRLLGGREQPDEHRILEHLLWDYQSSESTFWRNIRRLPGGHVLVGSARAQTVTRTWKPSGELADLRDAPAAHERFRQLFIQSLERRLESNRPLIAHLSGGIDSSLIVCAANEIYTEGAEGRPSLHAGAERYPGLASDEGGYIGVVAASVGFPVEEWDGRVAQFDDLDSPSLAGPAMRAHKNSGSAGDLELAGRLGARVILAGQAGDQLGSTLGLPDDLIGARKAAFLWDTVRRRGLSLDQRLDRARSIARLLTPSTWRRAIARPRLRRRVPTWLRDEWREHAVAIGERAYDRSSLQFPTRVQEGHWRELTGSRLGLGIDKEQRCAAVAGVEVRFPFLDRELVEMVLTIPPRCWPTPTGYARIQRDAFSALLPQAIQTREKMAFSPVMAHRVRTGLSRLAGLVQDGEWVSERFVKRDAAKALFDRVTKSGESDREDVHALWRIGTLEAWLRAVFEYYSSPEV